MNRVFLLSMVITALLVSLGCRSESEALLSREESQPVAPGNAGGGVLADPDVLGAEPGDKITDRRTVAATYDTLNGRRVLRIKLDLVTIGLNIEDAIKYFEKQSTAHPNLTDEKTLAENLRSEQGTGGEYHCEDFPPSERDRIYFCLASLLEEGSFLMTRNDTNQRVLQIVACKYSNIRGPRNGCAGRLFLLEDGTEFFRTMDQIY